MLGRVIDAVLLNGTVGAGKSTTAAALSDRLAAQGVVHALIDLDAIRVLRPPPPHDPFQQSVLLANLRDVAANYRAAGARRLILAGVVESARDLGDVRGRLDAELRAVRLVVDEEVGRARLRRRHEHDPDALEWHLDRSPALAAILERAALDDDLVDTTGLSPAEAAALVADVVGW